MHRINDVEDRSLSIIKSIRKYLKLIISIIILVIIGFIVLMLRDSYLLIK